MTGAADAAGAGSIAIAIDVRDAVLADRLAALLEGVPGLRLVAASELLDGGAELLLTDADARADGAAAVEGDPEAEVDAAAEDDFGFESAGPAEAVARRSRAAAATDATAALATRRAPRQAPALTPRETEVLALLAEGASNKLIARRLGISVHTAKFHVGRVLERLDATGRTDAVAQAVRQGVLML